MLDSQTFFSTLTNTLVYLSRNLADAAGVSVAAFVDNKASKGEILLAIEEAFRNTRQSAPEVVVMD